MSTLTMTIVAVFCVGYFLIALESVTRINKAAIALLMMAVTWTTRIRRILRCAIHL